MSVFDKISGIGVASGFKLQSKSPLDPRTVVDTIEDRNALIAENGAYEGIQVYVKDNKKTYCLKDLSGETWEEVGAGGGGGSSVQPDYEQNDSTAADYIKNRPFYSEKQPTEVDRLDIKEVGDASTTVTYNGEDYELTKTTYAGIVAYGNISILISEETNTGEPILFLPTYIVGNASVNGSSVVANSVIDLGDTCTITFNGVEYEVTKKTFTVDTNTLIYYGNGSIIGYELEDTGEPFAFLSNLCQFDYSERGSFVSTEYLTSLSLGTTTVMKDNLKYLDPKFIKDMYYEETVEVEPEVLYEGVFSTTYNIAELKGISQINPTVGSKLIVVLDNTEYQATVNVAGIDNNCLYIGNLAYFNAFGGNYKNTGEPYVILFSDLKISSSTSVDGEIIKTNTTYTDAKIQIKGSDGKTEVHTIGAKYIKDMYFENDPSEIILADNLTIPTMTLSNGEYSCEVVEGSSFTNFSQQYATYVDCYKAIVVIGKSEYETDIVCGVAPNFSYYLKSSTFIVEVSCNPKALYLYSSTDLSSKTITVKFVKRSIQKLNSKYLDLNILNVDLNKSSVVDTNENAFVAYINENNLVGQLQKADFVRVTNLSGDVVLYVSHNISQAETNSSLDDGLIQVFYAMYRDNLYSETTAVRLWALSVCYNKGVVSSAYLGLGSIDNNNETATTIELNEDDGTVTDEQLELLKKPTTIIKRGTDETYIGLHFARLKNDFIEYVGSFFGEGESGVDSMNGCRIKIDISEKTYTFSQYYWKVG